MESSLPGVGEVGRVSDEVGIDSCLSEYHPRTRLHDDPMSTGCRCLGTRPTNGNKHSKGSPVLPLGLGCVWVRTSVEPPQVRRAMFYRGESVRSGPRLSTLGDINYEWGTSYKETSE